MSNTYYILIGFWLICTGFPNHGNAQVLSLEWDRNLGGVTQFDEVRDVCHDMGGNVYTAGIFRNTSDFDPGVGVFNETATYANNAFVQKMDGSGNFQWVRTLDGPNSNAMTHCVAVNDLGDVFLVGTFSDSADFDPGPGTDFKTSQGTGDIFIWKFNAQGDYQWVKILRDNGVHNNQKGQLAFDSDYNIYLTGSFRGTVDFDPGVSSNIISSSAGGGVDMFVLKLDSNGAFVWAHGFGAQTSGSIYGRDIAIGNSGELWLTGLLGPGVVVDMDPGAGTQLISTVGGSDAYILKLDLNGQYQWGYAIGGNGSFQEEGRAILPSANGGAYLMGVFSGTVDFDPGPGTYNLTADYYDVFVLKLNSAGNFVWAGALIGRDTDDGYGFALDNQENLYLSGQYDTDIDLDPGPGTNLVTTNGGGASDVFLCKLDSSGNMAWGYSLGGPFSDGPCYLSLTDNHEIYLAGRFHTNFDSDPGPGNSNLNSNGSLDIFVAKLNEQVILGYQFHDILNIHQENGVLKAAGLPGAYRWLDCNKGFSPLRGQIDREFRPVVDGDYAVERTLEGRVDTSLCVKVQGIQSGEEILFSQVVIYPNPVDRELYLDLGSLSGVDVQIFDINGRRLLREIGLETAEYRMELDLVPGMYILELQTNGKRKRYRLIKE